MNSPITGKEMILQKEKRSLVFRKETFEVVYHYYLCTDSQEQFTTTALDEINMVQLYHQYRAKHHLPFPEEIIAIREKYDLPANKMSDILGFGANSYRNYENGEVPNHSNGKLIKLANNPAQFKSLVEICELLDEKTKTKLLKRIDTLIEAEEANQFSFFMEDYLLDGVLPDEFSGYKKPNLKRFTEMVVFFTEVLQPWKTQLNKLLFYADFLLFKKTCQSMSGARYRAINMGPVPNNFQSIFEYIANNDDVDIFQTEFKNSASIGEQFKPRKDRPFNAALFSEIELQVLQEVATKFKGTKTKEIIDISHEEIAWLENEKSKNIISYKTAFELKQF